MAAKPEAPKATAKPGDAKAAADAPKKSGKLLWIIIGAVVLLLAAGGGAYAFLSKDGHSESAEAPPEPAIFVPLEAFTVNLLPADGMQQYLQVHMTLKVPGQTTADTMKTRMPELRNRILMILSAKRPAELLPVAGKQKLAAEIGEAVHGMVDRPKAAAPAAAKGGAPDGKGAPAADAEGAKGNAPRPGAAVEVLFTAFIIQ